MSHMASSDEDESLAASLGITGGVGSSLAGVASGSASTAGLAGASAASNHLGQDSAEEEGPYHFRRSKFSQYHKVSLPDQSQFGTSKALRHK